MAAVRNQLLFNMLVIQYIGLSGIHPEQYTTLFVNREQVDVTVWHITFFQLPRPVPYLDFRQACIKRLPAGVAA